MAWWVFIVIGAAVLLSVYGLFRWASADPGIDAENAKNRFRAEQDWRAARRPGGDGAQAGTQDRLQDLP